MKVDGSSTAPRAALEECNGIGGKGGKDIDGGGDGKGLHIADRGNISIEEPYYGCPRERMKEEEKGETGAQRITRTLGKMVFAWRLRQRTSVTPPLLDYNWKY